MVQGLYLRILLTIVVIALPCRAELQRFTLQPEHLTYHFTTHAYSSEQIQKGVRFWGVCSGSDSVAIVIDSASSATTMIVDLYGTDSSYSTVMLSREATAPCIVPAGGSAGTPFYFVIRPYSAAMASAGFRIYKAERCSLTIRAAGAGSTLPEGSLLSWIGIPLAIKAAAQVRSCFTGWTSDDTVSIASAGALQTTVTAGGHIATVTADFTALPVHPVTFAGDTFSFTSDGCQPLDGVLFSFTPASADTFHIALGRGDAITTPAFRWTWYTTDSTFTAPDSSTGTTALIPLRTVAPFTKHYFRIRPQRAADTAAFFSVKADSFYVLTVTPPAFGTVTPVVPVLLKSGESRACTLSLPSVLYALSAWRTVSGDANVNSATTLTPLVRLDSSDAVIEAVVTPKTLYSLQSEPDTFSYSTQGTWASGGILAVYTAAASDSFLLEVRKPAAHGNSIYYYGDDSTYTRIVGQRTLTTTNYYAFRSPSAGARCFFRIMPASATNEVYSCIAEVFSYCTLTVELDLGGSTRVQSVRLVREDSLLTMMPPVLSGNYYFGYWSVIAGGVTMYDSAAPAAKVALSSAATVRAVCPQRPLTTISHEWDTLSYTDVQGGSRGGMLFAFSSMVDDSFEAVFEAVDNHTLTLLYYDTAAACSFVAKSVSGTSLRLVLPPAPGKTRYIRVAPASAADSSKQIHFRYYGYVDLILAKEGVGSVDTFAVKKVREESIAAISAPVVNSGYYFSHWKTLSGAAVAGDSMSMSTTVMVTDDCVMHALFAQRPVAAVSYVWDSLSYEEVDGGTRGGLLFSYVATSSDARTIVFVESAGRTFNASYYGTDSLCSTAVATERPAGTYRYTFTPAAPGEIHYFRVWYYNAADSVDAIRFKMLRSCTVTCISDAGTVLPQRAAVDADGSIPILAETVSSLYLFDHWRVATGHATIADSLMAQTTVTVDSVDATLEALFKRKTVYPVTFFDSVYTYGDHGDVSGILLSFTAPSTKRYAVTVTPSTNSSKCRLVGFGSDSLFAAAIDSSEGDSIYCSINADSGRCYYVLVRPADAAPGTGTSNFSIRYRDIYAITTTAASGGDLGSGGKTAVLPEGFSVTDSAFSHSPLWYFDYWKTVSGAVSYGNGSDSSKTAITAAAAGGDAVLEAIFTKKNIHALTTTDTYYQFSAEGAPGSLVLLQYTAQRADSFAIEITLSSSYYHGVVTYGTDSLYKTALSTITSSTARTHSLKMYAAAPGTQYCITVYTVASNENSSFTARVDTTVTLSLLHDAKGGVGPADDVGLFVNASASIRAFPVSPRFFFSAWRYVSGDVAIADTQKAATTVTVHRNSSIRAVFGEKEVHAVGASADTFSYWRDGAPAASGGIIMAFTAPRADTFALSLLEAGTYSRSVNVLCYGTDSLLLQPLQTFTNKPKASLTGFRAAAAGERLFFRVEPVNSAFYADSIAVVVREVVPVEISDNGLGTTSPAGVVYVVAGKEQGITATPTGMRYTFDRWSTEGGTVLFGDSLLSATTFQAFTASAIKAHFRAFDVHEIPRAPVSGEFAYNVQEKSGLYMQASVGAVDSFYIWIRHGIPSIKKNFYYYGADSTFTTVVAATELATAGDTLLKFKAPVNTRVQYFRVLPQGTNVTDAFAVLWGGYDTLRVTGDDGSYVLPDTPVVKAPGTRVQIETYPQNRLFTFSHWRVDAGYAAVADTAAAVTAATIDPRGGGTVRAVYAVAPHDTLFLENDGHGMTVPVDYLLLDTTLDTTVAAYPDRYYRFDHWEAVAGNPLLSDVSGNTARVKCHGTSRLKAWFTPDSSAQTELTINSISPGGFPRIELQATLRNVAQTGSAASPLLSLMQDSIPQTITVQPLSEIHGISVALAIDRSQTMGYHHRIDTARAAAKAFIDAMDPLDKASIIAFSTGAEVVQPLTDDRAALLASLERIVPAGETAIRDGAYTGATQLINESTTRAVIIFSDGFENASSISLDSVITFARKNGIAIYSIAVGAEAIALVDATLRPLADSTGGSLYYAKSTGDLATLYIKIKQDIESRYVITYTSPDTVENGDIHRLVLAAAIDAAVVKDTGSWQEMVKGPSAVIPPVDDSATTPDENLVVVPVVITGVAAINPESKLCYRNAGSSDSFACVVLEQKDDSLYLATMKVDSTIRGSSEYIVITGANDTIAVFRGTDTGKGTGATNDTLSVAAEDTLLHQGGTTVVTTIDTSSGTGVPAKKDNHPPEVYVDESTVVNNADSVVLLVTATDPDGDSVRFTLISSSDSVRLAVKEEGSAVILLNRTATGNDSVAVLFTVDDGVATVTVRIVLPWNSDKVSRGMLHAGTLDTIVAPGSAATIAVWTDDNKGDEDMSVSGLPEGAVYTQNADGGSGVITWTPSENSVDTIVTIVRGNNLPGVKPDTLTIRLRSGVYRATAVLSDTNGNGFIDRMHIQWEGEARLALRLPDVTAWMDSVVLTLDDAAPLALLPLRAIKTDSMHVEVVLLENSRVLHTGFKEAKVLCSAKPVTIEPYPTSIVRVLDAAGPVIKKAYVKGGGIGAASVTDSFILQLSEPVVWKQSAGAPDHLIKGYSARGKGNPFNGLGVSSVVNRRSSGLIISMQNRYLFTDREDSVALVADSAAPLADSAGNTVHPCNRRAPVEVAFVDDAELCPNPFTPGRSRDPVTGKTGSRVIVQCHGGARHYRGVITIFNVLGNVVLRQRDMSPSQQNDRWLTWLWDGRDEQGRVVGNGMYAVKIDLSSNDTKTTLYRKVGVVREER